jgi:hypothetical protein
MGFERVLNPNPENSIVKLVQNTQNILLIAKPARISNRAGRPQRITRATLSAYGERQLAVASEITQACLEATCALAAR